MRIVRQHHILMVADNMATVSLATTIERMGMICTTVPDNQAAIDKMRLVDFDVILIDLSETRMTCDLLIAIEHTAIEAIPIVMAEATEMQGIVNSVEFEAFEFIAKPAPESVVFATLHKAIKRRLAMQNIPAMNRLAAQWQDVFEAFPDMIIVLHEDGRILRVNPALTSQMECAKDDLIDQQCHQVICGDTHKPDQCPFNHAGQGGKALLTEFTRADWGGAFEMASVALMNGNENTGSLHIIRDITERHRAQQEITMLAKFPDENPNPVIRVSAAGKLLYSNSASTPVLTAMSDDAQQNVSGQWLDMIHTAMSTNQSSHVEIDCQGDRLFQLEFAPIVEANYVNVYGLDITEQKQAKRKLKQADARNRMLLGSISSVLIGLDANGAVTFWNKNAQNTLGVSDDQVIGKQLCDCEVPWNFQQISEGLATCLAQLIPVRVDDIMFTRPDNRSGLLAITINPIKDESSDKPGYLILGRDITDRKVLETQLAQAKKLEGIGQLAAGIAHEINTPMQYFGDNTRFLQGCFDDLSKLMTLHGDLLAAAREANLKPDLICQLESMAAEADIEYLTEEIPKALSQSLDGLGQVTRIVSAMREFSHPGLEEKVLVNINEAIETTITVCRNEWKYVAEMKTDFQADIGSILCLPGELHQVLLNIIVNAAHAIGDMVGDAGDGKGTISIQTRKDIDWIDIRISDTGGGIPEEIASKVFDPFFTTKDVGRGTGQGLAISHTVITEKHGGTITFEANQGKGTTFIIRLPVTTESSESDTDNEKELINVA